MRNKKKDFPDLTMNGENGKARAKAKYASKRADGSIQTHPNARMQNSTQREDT